MKKVTSIILAFLLILDTCGYFVVYLELSYYFKQEAAAKLNDIIPHNELQVLAFHISDLSKTDSPVNFIKKKEFKYDGELYDIYRQETVNDSVYFYCVKDHKENNLEKLFSIYVENKTQDNSKNTPMKNILSGIFKIAIVPVTYNNIYNKSSIKFIIQNTNLFPQISIDIPTPPPKSFI